MASRAWALGCMDSKTGLRIWSYEGMGVGSKREAGMAQRSISRSNTDSAPKKKAAMSTKPSTSPNQRSEEHTSELQSPCNLVCRLLLEKKKKITVGDIV